MGNLATLHGMDLLSRYSMLVMAPPKNPSGVWDAYAAARITVFGRPACLQMHNGGESKNEAWLDFWSDRNIRHQFHRKGSNPWMLGRRSGLARGIYSRTKEDGRFAGEAVLNEIRYCVNTALNHCGFSAYHLVFGSIAADPYAW